MFAPRPSARSAFAALIALTLTTVRARDAEAQQAGWSLDRFDPAPAGDLFLSAQSPSYLRPNAVSPRFALVTAYALRPLGASVVVGGAPMPVSAVEHVLVTHAQVNLHLAQRLGLDLGLPIYWMQRGSTDPALPVRQVDGVALGDMRLGVRVRALGHAERDGASLHFGAVGYLGFLGTGSRAQETSDGRVRARFFAAGAGRAGLFRWALTAGVHARPGFSAAFAYIGNELYANAGLGLSFASDRVTAGLEGSFSVTLDRAFQSDSVALEALAVAKAHLLDGQLQLGLGGGPGLTQAPGTPTFRGVFTLAIVPNIAPPRPQSAPVSSPQSAPVGPRGGNAVETPGVVPVPVEPVVTPPPASFCDPVAGGEGCSTGDRDNDGVREPLDECPDVPAGELHDAHRAGCPASDRDSDTVPDDDDQCADEAQGAVPDPERRGCPMPDRDGDRIADAHDHCPDAAGAPHPDPNVNGCPGLVQLDEGTLRILQPIFFAPNRDAVEARSTPVLEGVRQALLARPDIRSVVVEGHTDDRGNDEINVDLSHRRAAAVVRWLTDHGVDPARLVPRGYGPTRPRTALRPNMTRAQANAARTNNRRVQFELVTP